MRRSSTASNGKATTRKNSVPARPSRVARKIKEASKIDAQVKNLASESPKSRTASPEARDRVVLMVRDPFWLHAHWDLRSSTIHRAEAAMAEHWHTAKPVIRLFEVVTGNTTSTIETHVRDIPIHGGVNNWYIDVVDPPKGYRVEIGYLAGNGNFHSIARSNSVITPKPGGSDSLDENWQDVAENCEKIFALSGGYSQDNCTNTDEIQELFEERLRRPMGSPMVTRYGEGAQFGIANGRKFKLQVDAEMIVFGSTHPDAHVTLGSEPVKLRPDGTFTVRLSMPDRRQVIPVVASSGDGTKQQTIVLAVERNTKVMETVVRDSSV